MIDTPHQNARKPTPAGLNNGLVLTLRLRLECRGCSGGLLEEEGPDRLPLEYPLLFQHHLLRIIAFLIHRRRTGWIFGIPVETSDVTPYRP